MSVRATDGAPKSPERKPRHARRLHDPESARRSLLLDRQPFNGLLAKQLPELAAKVDKAAITLDRPGRRAIRNRLVKAMCYTIHMHRIARRSTRASPTSY